MSRYSTSSSTSPSVAIEDSKKKTSLLKDNSWIKKPDDEDEAVDRDPNFGREVLRSRSSETIVSSEPEKPKTTRTLNTSTSVSALSKRFSGSQDELKSSTLPTTRTSRNTYTTRSSVTEEPKTSTTTTTITENGKTTETTITTSQTVRTLKTPTKTGTFTERVFSDVKSSSKVSPYSTYSPSKTTKVTETTVTTNKEAEDHLFDTLLTKSAKDTSPSDSKTSISTTETVIVKSRGDDPEDKLYDSLIPKRIKEDSPDSRVYSTETVTVKRRPSGDGIKTATTTRTSSTTEDSLYDTLLPKSITSNPSTPTSTSVTKIVTVESSRGSDSPTLSSSTRSTSYSSITDEYPSTRTSSYTISSMPSDKYSSDIKTTSRTSSYSSYTDDIPSTRTSSYSISTSPSDDYSSTRKSYTYSSPDSTYDYKSITSPSTYTSYRSSSRSDEPDSFTRSSFKSTERTILDKDLCTSCRKPFTGDAKIILDEMKINCHATCFKCEVCNGTLGHLKAGDTMWIYKHMVHCERCFEVTRDKWHR
ncbi:sciellin isoform X1 [Sphaeramia orbicularis]|uniref:LIM zinc-binding domain-containing protein n=1 Tax=Sphaeramia orbicularis TaxID=375764 RepID=A0A673CPH0_9TELE|nr:sciellin isoform X1 [Sphaeramia orbicularis]